VHLPTLPYEIQRASLASLVAGVVAAPLPDTGVGSVGALEALLREGLMSDEEKNQRLRTRETCGTEALLQLAPMSQTAGVMLSHMSHMSTAPSTEQPPPPPVPTVSESSEEAVRPRKRRNLGLGPKLEEA
jgi:hypothetical protein